MKSLIVHIGYPKTATTTIQNKVLYNLHKEKIINFIGVAPINSNKSKEILNFIIYGNNYRINDSGTISEYKLNVISFEGLSSTYDFYLEKNKKIRELSITGMVKRLNDLRKNNDISSIKIVVSIRNHSDLIYSLFVQQYAFLFKNVKKIYVF